MISLETAVLRLLQYTVLLNVAWCAHLRRFPRDFKFGAASAAYQIEGAWNTSDKGENIWDRLVHTNPNIIINADNGDIATDSYHKWRQDVDIASHLGLDFYRFSISWARLLPTGLPNEISEDGKRYYNNLIDALLQKGIEPVVTLYHFDLPQKLQDLGGWTNPLISEWFADYAHQAFSIFGDRVKTWITINEANVVCDIGYNLGVLAPNIKEPILAPYLCNKHILIAHAKAYRIYDQYFRPKQQGRLSMANNLQWIEALTPADEPLAELAREHCAGRYSHPVFSEKGGWPRSIEKVMEDFSRKQGFNKSRLPSFTKEEIKMMRGSYDFYGLNYYTSRKIRSANPGEELGQWFFSGSAEINAVLVSDPNWPMGASKILPVYPEGIRRQIKWLLQQYGNVGFLITENGFSTLGYQLNDKSRVKFIRDHLEQVLLSIYEDGANVLGYTYWSMMDNFEWLDGYKVKFGLYEVDFNDPNRVRTPRKSAQYYTKIIRTKSIDWDTSSNMSYALPRFQSNGSENGASSCDGNLFFVGLICVFAFLFVNYVQIKCS